MAINISDDIISKDGEMATKHGLWMVGFLCCALLLGCGKGKDAPSDSQAKQELDPDKMDLPVIPISRKQHNPQETAADTKKTAEYFLDRIKQVRQRPFPQTENVEELAKLRRDRNLEIIEHCHRVLGLTHDQKDQAEVFALGVKQLMEAHMQLALEGTEDHVKSLYNHAAQIHQKYPKTAAAAEATFTLARFAHTNARRYGNKEARWLTEFARLARLFVTNFPKETERGLPLLASAAWSCELHGMTDEAKICYTQLAQSFPKSVEGKQAAAVLRRLDLLGKPLQLAGPTLKQGFVSIDHFKGKPTLIVFWSSDTNRFTEILPRLASIEKTYSRYGLRFLGVNLDAAQPDLESFLAKYPLTWPQIFYTDPAQRRWENPIVKHYGVRDIPQIWLVDSRGVVLDLNVTPDTIEQKVRAAFTARAPLGN